MFSNFNSHVYWCHQIALGLEKPEEEITVLLPLSDPSLDVATAL